MDELVRILYSDALHNVIDSGVKLTAALLAILWFLRRSEYRGRLNLEQDVVVTSSGEGKSEVITVEVRPRLMNVGSVPLQVKSLKVAALRTRPFPSVVEKSLAEAGALLSDLLTLPKLAVVRDPSEKAKLRIVLQPGETDTIPAYLRFKRGNVTQIVIVTQVEQKMSAWRFSRRRLFWRTRTVVDL